MNPASPWRTLAPVLAVGQTLLRARLPQVQVGEVCLLRAGLTQAHEMGRGVVVALDQGVAAISLLGPATGVSAQTIVAPTGSGGGFWAGRARLGCVLDGLGRVTGHLVDDPAAGEDLVWCRQDRPAPGWQQRHPITEPFQTGVRAVDALLTVGQGQRMGIFAPAGAGKTTLAQMLIAQAQADVCVIALIGERGREVAELVAHLAQTPQAARTVIVQATSDQAPALRCQAAHVATGLAEWYRDQGARVLLVLDSVTRYARALRDVALAAGELPARRGYPASVFEQLPRLVERAGHLGNGSITAFYTVLLEEEDGADPVGEEVKSLLDGHIFLSARLAGRGQFPAIDVLRSASRLFPALATPAQVAAATQVRELMGTLADLQLLRELGEYRPGANPVQDAALAREPALLQFLTQPQDQPCTLADAQEAVRALVN